MQLKDIMTKDVKTVAPDISTCKAAELMATMDVGVLPIVREGGTPIGVITDRDLAIRVVARNLDAGMTQVREVMTGEIATLPVDSDVREAAELMKRQQIRRIVVLDDDKKVAGIVSLGDLALSCRDDRIAGNVVEKVSQPPRPGLGSP